MTQASPAPSFDQRLRHRMETSNSLVCVGLDPAIDRLPAGIEATPSGVVEFCTQLISATADYAAAFKPNLGFYIGLGRAGLDSLWQVRKAIPAGIPVILDCKVGDIGSTAAAHAHGWFDEFDFDAITVNPYLGEDSLVPFMQDPTKGVLVVCKTSNPGSGDFQDLPIDSKPSRSLFLDVASHCREWNDRYPASVGLVVGATYPDQLRAVRGICKDQTILLPGLGAQGGDIQQAIDAGADSTGLGLLCSASRSIMYASSRDDFADAARGSARLLRDSINACRRTSPQITSE
ncbi:MAG: orotidine-5'-phosphate decarboxylase [Thermomicrobiales bacterium]